MAFGFAIALVYLLFERAYRTRLLGAFVMPVSFGLYASALVFPSAGQPTLVPALQNPTLLTIHVSVMILAYAVLAVAFGAAVMHIVQGNDRQRIAWLPSPRRAEELTHRAVLVGFPLLGAGVALGALWANDAWGRYWGWDPKETAALVTWLIFAVYLHARGLQPAPAGPGARPPRRRPAPADAASGRPPAPGSSSWASPPSCSRTWASTCGSAVCTRTRGCRSGLRVTLRPRRAGMAACLYPSRSETSSELSPLSWRPTSRRSSQRSRRISSRRRRATCCVPAVRRGSTRC